MLRVQASPRASAATMTFALPTPEPEAIFAKIFDTANLGGVVNRSQGTLLAPAL